MSADSLNRFWLSVTFLLFVLIIVSSLVIWSHRDDGQPLAVAPAQTLQFSGEIIIDGAVSRPGSYPLKSGDSIENIIQASGGTSENADLSGLQLYIPQKGEGTLPQKIDINRADVWLLQALPDIGEVRAQAIVDYRRQNGTYHSIEEITKVPGISKSVFEKIKSLITIGE
jgi:competence protein ComEA